MANDNPTAGLSGNALARARRAMLSQGGKKGMSMLAAAPRSRARPDQNTAPQAAAASVASPAEPPAQAERTAESAIAEEALDTLCVIAEDMPTALGDTANTVRDLCRDRRRALSIQGKSALPQKPANGGSGERTGREIARARRAEMSKNGRGDAPAPRPSGRIRVDTTQAPPKVEAGTTLSGSTVTGTQVERTPRVTGTEQGSCRNITGTEYIGTEQFDTFCVTRPVPSATKVGVSATSHGQRVSGAEVGRSAKVTGDEPGSCKPVTGTEYLGNENFVSFCEGRGLLSRPQKAATGATERKGIAITGADEARLKAVTGGEAGAKRAITGSQYADAGASRLTINGPTKVALTHTLAGRTVSGTEVGRSVKVTGDEAGACRTVSGTEYISNEQFQSVCHTRPEPAPAKTGEDTSRGGQRVTGNLVDRSERVTGNEPGTCQRVTGSQYAKGSAAKECEPASEPPPAQAAAAPRSPTGTTLGGNGRVTGGDVGRAQHISGTPYASERGCSCGCGCGDAAPEEADAATAIPAMPARFQPTGGRPRAMAMSMRPAEPRPESFSVTSPSQEVRGRITGSGYGGTGRITGPVNMAAGLVSGTPEFRYRDENAGMIMMQPKPAAPAAEPMRITGEGREGGAKITGDDWARSGRVTGTEGRCAQGRNPTQRGMRGGMVAGARSNMGRERPEMPLAKVTGSSGNAGKGALITVSGGARG